MVPLPPVIIIGSHTVSLASLAAPQLKAGLTSSSGFPSLGTWECEPG